LPALLHPTTPLCGSATTKKQHSHSADARLLLLLQQTFLLLLLLLLLQPAVLKHCMVAALACEGAYSKGLEQMCRC
jgi:hypothetical protein